MDQSTLNLFFGVGSVGAVLGLIIVAFLQHRQLGALTDVLAATNSNPAIVSAIKGATDGIPQVAFVKALAVLSALHTLAPGQDQQALIDQLSQLLERVDHDPSDDPIPPATFTTSSTSVADVAIGGRG